MAKPNKAHHDRCVKYKNRGQREINKKIKQARDKKRIARFARRKAEGKTYEYKPLPPRPENGNEAWVWDQMKADRVEKSRPYKNKTDLQKWTSIMRKVQNEIDEQLRLEKREESAGKKKKDKK